MTHSLVRELHKIAVQGLTREGDRTPGAYRTTDVTIGGSTHTPPSPIAVQGDMSELDFVNQPVEQSFDLLKVAISHHRFVWIHPFGNGNGRVCRLFTYAIMVSQGFTNTTEYRALNPTSVFGSDRYMYYRMLEIADSLEPDAIIQWSSYLLDGMLEDLQKMSQLSDETFVVDALLKPAIKRGVASGCFPHRKRLFLMFWPV
ncbi:Fic family protein [Arthrobacter alpinus]|nr:Fic family protein [Arthrobacter alpinus]